MRIGKRSQFLLAVLQNDSTTRLGFVLLRNHRKSYYELIVGVMTNQIGVTIGWLYAPFIRAQHTYDRQNSLRSFAYWASV